MKAPKLIPAQFRYDYELSFIEQSIIELTIFVILLIFEKDLLSFFQSLIWCFSILINGKKNYYNLVLLPILKYVQPSTISILLLSFCYGITESKPNFAFGKLALYGAFYKWRITLFSFMLICFPLIVFGFKAFIFYYLKYIQSIQTPFLNPKTDPVLWISASTFFVVILCSRFKSFEIPFIQLMILIFILILSRFFGKSLRFEAKMGKSEINVQKEQEKFQLLLLVTNIGLCSLLITFEEFMMAYFYGILVFIQIFFQPKVPKGMLQTRWISCIQSFGIIYIGLKDNFLSIDENIETKGVLFNQIIFFFLTIRCLSATNPFSLDIFRIFVSDGACFGICFVITGNYPLFHTFLYLNSIVIFLIEGYGRITTQKLIIKERSTQNFVDHAIKQKFAATGTALGIALSDKLFRSTISKDTLNVVEAALATCQFGSYLCHEATLKRQISDKTFFLRCTSRLLSSVINEWSQSWPGLEIICLYNQDVYLNADWSLVFMTLEGLACRARARDLSSNFTLIVNIENSKLVLNLENIPSFALIDTEAFQLFANILNGTFQVKRKAFKNVATMLVPISFETEPVSKKKIVKEAKTVLPTNTNKSKKKVSNNYQLPSNLVFACLDDSPMVRVNLKLILSRDLKASPKSEIKGETQEEAEDFVAFCMKLKPDICILDENLDYTDGGGALILGSSVAENLRVAGYNGVIIMHSANELLKNDYADYSTVDGFIVKGISRELVRIEIENILRSRIERLS